LTLETQVSRILPTFTGGGREHVTLRHLLTHTSGLLYESPQMNQRLADRVPMDVLLDEAYEYPLLFAPGTRLHYSDYGFALLGRVASTVAGRPFRELVHELVIDPAGLRDTYFPPPPSLYGRMAHVAETQAYGTDGAMYNTPHAIDLAHPAFGVVATVSDLLRFGLLLGPREGVGVLSRASVRRMTSNQNSGHVNGSPYDESTPAPFPWGLGLFITGHGAFGPDLSSPQTFGHDGGSGCTLWVDPVHEVAAAYVSNRHYLPDPPWFFRRLLAVGNTILAATTRNGESDGLR
jgi:CubicO group peptidase (beta-lactamase class C family)